MPRLSQTLTVSTPTIQFVVSAPRDMLNAMYFTSLVPQIEGIDCWPARLRNEMAPDLLAELDFLYNYPAGDPGILGTLNDNLVALPQTWRDVDALLTYVRAIPDGVGDLENDPGIQGLIYQTTFRHLDEPERIPYAALPARDAIRRRIESLDDRDAPAAMAWYDRPGELRTRMVRLIERFYDEHYAKELPNRLPALERSAALHRAERLSDPLTLARKLTGRSESCLEGVCSGAYERFVFSPSVDMGPYVSCAIVSGIHGLQYPLEEEFSGAGINGEETRLARVYKALGDEQRLRILRLLRGRERYAQEIVEATGLHQSVVSRHLSFMKAVGLVTVRRQNNMKFFAVDPDARDLLSRSLDLFPENAA